MSPKSPAIQVALRRLFRASMSVAGWLMSASSDSGSTGNVSDAAVRSTARPGVAHPRLWVHAQTVEDAVDEVEVADALDGIDHLLVLVTEPSQGVEIPSRHLLRVPG